MNILFLCTGNSCRSQMAEGWARQMAGEDFEIQSAGIEAHGQNPRAISVMREAGVDISTQESTRLTDEMLAAADLVVTVCGHADEHCPAVPAGTKKVHWPLSDPARARGDEAAVMETFRATRDEVERRVRDLIRLSQGRIKVFCGTDDLALESFFMGAVGFISVIGNIVPGMSQRLFDQVQAGDLDGPD